MKVYLDHSNITQNMHGASRNYRYVLDVSCTPTSSIGELTLAHMCIRCMAIPTPHIISIICLFLAYDCPHMCEPFNTFLSSSSTFFLFRRLGVNFLAHAHPLHECSKCQKGVDQFNLYLASGLGTSPDKNSKETKCETLVDSCSQQSFSLSSQSLACTQTPFGDIRVTNSKSSCTFCSFVACVNANIDSCLLRLELNCML